MCVRGKKSSWKWWLNWVQSRVDRQGGSCIPRRGNSEYKGKITFGQECSARLKEFLWKGRWWWVAGRHHIIMGLRCQGKKFEYYPEWRHQALESNGAEFKFNFFTYLVILDKLLNLSRLYLSSKIISSFQGSWALEMIYIRHVAHKQVFSKH